MITGERATRRTRSRQLLEATLGLTQLWLSASTAYLLMLLVNGRRPASPVAAREPVEWPPMLVLVPAHDEETIIEQCVAALVSQDYPGDCSVVVIADNCSDRTATIARDAGATVLSRTDAQAPGKGHALNWALQRLQDSDEEIVMFVDADCVASPNLCREVARAMSRSQVSVVQARYDVSNPEASTTSALRAGGFLLKHVIQPRGRERLGLSCGLFGSGMAFRRSLMREVTWPTSVTEDIELHLRLVRSGTVVHYLETGSVTSPMPLSSAQAAEQQLRWESGNAEMRRRYGLKLIAAGVTARRMPPVASGLELFIPPQSLLVGASVSLGSAFIALRRPRLGILGAATAAADGLYVVAGLAFAGASPETFRALIASPGFMAGRLRVIGRVMSGRRASGWVRTRR
ncbi:MAG TPA: glycosyltransferase family 2 protein [Solirubrobacteraceae bacterium]|nr:glycosyltransferase family 2 protein [Solirubrobacteraceae bacterium]